MDDLISRKKLLNEINAYVVGSQDKEFICKLIKEMPSAQQWIPCSEMLPMDKGVYLVTDDSGRVAWVEKSWFMWCDDGSPFWEYANVTAWMPLPEAFKDKYED